MSLTPSSRVTILAFGIASRPKIDLKLHLALPRIASEVKVRNTKAQVVVSMRPSFYQTTDDFEENGSR